MRWKTISLALLIILVLSFLGYFTYRNRFPVKTDIFIHNQPQGCNDDKAEKDKLITPTVTSLILDGAKRCVQESAQYTPGYFKIRYPMGDLPLDKGVCTDVIIRSFRNAGIDLQELIHLDMKNRFESYPQLWGLKEPDANIDHRRIPNQMCFFKRYGKQLTLKTNKDTLNEWQPSDIVYWRLDNGLLHCGIISNKRNRQEEPYVIHNLCVTSEEDCLTKWQIIGHFRYPSLP